MKKNIFKVLSSTTLATVIMVPSVFAAELSSDVGATDQLETLNNFETVADIPEGAVPPTFNTVQEANVYLNGNITPFATQIIVRNGSFNSTSDSELQATLGYERVNGKVNLVSVSSQAIGDGAYTFKQSSYSTKSLDSGRSLGITIKGTLTKTIVVGGKIQKTNYSESVYVEI